MSHAREVRGDSHPRDEGERAVHFLKLGEGTYIQVNQVETVKVIDGGDVRIRTLHGGDLIELSIKSYLTRSAFPGGPA